MPATLIDATAEFTEREKKKQNTILGKNVHTCRLLTSAFNTGHIEMLCIYTKNVARIQRSFNGTNLPRQRRQRPRDTHHHYGAQQVGRLEVDPMSEKK